MSKNTTKKVYIIHGWGGNTESGFKPWLKKELEARGYLVNVPFLPDTDYPVIKKWVPFLTNYIKDLDDDTILVGHSLGCQAIFRFLSEQDGVSVGKIVIVAGVFDRITNMSEEESSVARPWLETPIDQEKVKSSAKKIVAFFSDNDKWIPLDSEKIARERYGAKTIIEHGMGHYSDDDKIFKVPSVLNEIIN